MVVEVLEIVARLLGAVFALVLLYYVPKVSGYIKEKVDEEKLEKLRRFISELVSAAEQMYRAEDPDGTIRKKYVQDQILAIGFKLTDYVDALIESAVYDLNLFQNK